jgi:putative sigma-54 modulation protein
MKTEIEVTELRSMPLQITGRHLTVTAQQRNYIEKKLARLRRHFGDIDELAVTIGMEKKRHVVEISFRAGSIQAFTKGADDGNSLVAIDQATDRLEAQVGKARDKRWRDKKHSGRGHRGGDSDEEEEMLTDSEEAVE